MLIEVRRQKLTEDSTVGKMFIDGQDVGIWTLEDPVRDHKIPGHTAIPAGTYKVVIDYSPHFKRDLPRLLNVPNFEYVRIHSGNTTADSEGCILVGKSWSGKHAISESRLALDKLLNLIKAATSVEIKITNP